MSESSKSDFRAEASSESLPESQAASQLESKQMSESFKSEFRTEASSGSLPGSQAASRSISRLESKQMSESSKSEFRAEASSESLPESKRCSCTENTSSTESLLSPHCECSMDEHEIVIHQETCLMYKNETFIFPHEVETCECQDPPFESGVCECCACLPDQCYCKKAGREAFDEWRRRKRDFGPLPAVLETTHPLMQKFQDTLKRFLEKENAVAEAEIQDLRQSIKLNKTAYDNALEAVYRSDHDTNGQRALIEEYEATVAEKMREREESERRAREAAEKYRRVKEKLDQNTTTEQEAVQEVEALEALCRQLETWREETESELTISQRVTDKMRAEKRVIADEKRQLDMLIYGLNNEVWKLESRKELFKKQLEIKSHELEIVTDRTTNYAADLDDLELDKKRLMALWNGVLANIKQRDLIFDSVRDDYRVLQENYRTLVNNLEISKKISLDEMNKSRDLAMVKDKLIYDINGAAKQFDVEEARREVAEKEIAEISYAIQMNERDQEMIQSENIALRNILATTFNECERKNERKLKIENEILENLQLCLLNDKAVESMAKGITKMREMSRKLEINLQVMENQHAKLMLDLEIARNRQAEQKLILEKNLDKVRQKEAAVQKLEEKYEHEALVIIRKQRELDIVPKKYTALKELFDLESPQERRIREVELQIKALRERTETLQHDWLRLQGHVVKLTQQHHKLVADINLLTKQIQICEQKSIYIQAECVHVQHERDQVERALRGLSGQLQVLERTRKEAADRNQHTHLGNLSITHEYAANLKGAESEIFQLEEDIEALDKEKINLTKDLDRVQREALIWQRKGILAVELRRNMQNAKSAAGEIGQMKNEIHRMEVRREQLRRTGEQLAEDLAQYVTRRECALDKGRAQAAVERGREHTTSQTTYHHKLRLARADIARHTKDLTETNSQLEDLQKERERLERELAETSEQNAQLEENIATLMRDCRHTERNKQWLLERVVRNQRLGSELVTAVKRQSVRVKKPKSAVLAEYNQARALNDRIRFIVEALIKEYPHLDEKLEAIMNTLTIHTPSGSPRLTEEADEICEFPEEGGEDEAEEEGCQEYVAEKPLDPDFINSECDFK